jgi:multicomponent Na+:H+ antiporter subunit D
MCFLQTHLKRLLAFSTISHTGLFLVGIAVLNAHGLSGSVLFVLAHGMTKASLFMFAGIVGHRLGSVAVPDLHGRGRRLWATGPLFMLGGLALASLPPFGPYLGKALVEEAADKAGYAWIPPVFMVVSILAGGAILRAGLRIFWGVGEPAAAGRSQTDEEGSEDEPESTRGTDKTPFVMFLPAVLLLAGGYGIAFVTHVKSGLDKAATIFEDRAGYATQVLHGHHVPRPPAHVASGPHTSSLLYAIGAVAGAVLLALSGVYAPRLRGRMPRLADLGRAAGGLLHSWHSGHIGDYVTWLVVGMVVVGWTLGIAVR